MIFRFRYWIIRITVQISLINLNCLGKENFTPCIRDNVKTPCVSVTESRIQGMSTTNVIFQLFEQQKKPHANRDSTY